MITNYNLERHKINQKTITQYEIYKSYFPNLKHELFNVLLRNGMLGRMYRGQEINLKRENICIPFCLWRNAVFIKTNQFVPCVLKTNNPYWCD